MRSLRRMLAQRRLEVNGSALFDPLDTLAAAGSVVSTGPHVRGVLEQDVPQQ
jgi:hypothetical protein